MACLVWQCDIRTGIANRAAASPRGARELIRHPRPLAVNKVALLDPLRSVQFSHRGLGFTSSLSLSLSRSLRLLSSPTFLGASMHFGSTISVIIAM